MTQAYNKPVLTIQQQISQLQQRGMVITNKESAAHYLSHINYYRLGAYWLNFESDHATHTFIQNTTFEQVLNLYIFDRELRLLVLDAIERVEVSVRTQYSYQLSHQYGPHPHLITHIYKSPSSYWDYQQALTQLKKEANASKEVFAKHLLTKYKEPLPPIWAAVEIMTIGQLSKWYENLAYSADRNKIARVFNMDETNLVSFLHHISTVRNLCAHHSRLWNRAFQFTFKLPRNRPANILTSLNTQAPKQLYNSLVMLAYLLDQAAPNHHWKVRLINLIHQYNIDPSLMGFPLNWQTKPIWQ
jgi:abortive infection bacteriophage resistance protein